MALDLLTTTAFERDLRRLERQRKDIDKLEDIVNLLQARKPLPPRCRPMRSAAPGRGIGTAMSIPTGFCSTE